MHPHLHDRTYRTREFYRANQNNDRSRRPQLRMESISPLQYVGANQAWRDTIFIEYHSEPSEIGEKIEQIAFAN